MSLNETSPIQTQAQPDRERLLAMVSVHLTHEQMQEIDRLAMDTGRSRDDAVSAIVQAVFDAAADKQRSRFAMLSDARDLLQSQ